MLTDNEFEKVVEQFPEIEFGFAYGSGVVKQDGYKYTGELQAGDISSPEESVASAELPMVDMIFAVEDPEIWHSKNMMLNPAHYSPLVEVSPQTLTHIQNSYGAGMWYNAMISMNLERFPNRLMKYGVIGRERLVADLSEWTTLYAAGRLQKPVRVIKSGFGDEFNEALERNRRNALRIALLLMPRKFEETKLYETVASLSYVGDPRMLLGENPQKVVNLVKPVVPQYRTLYKEFIDEATADFGLKSEYKDGLRIFHQNTAPAGRWRLILSLPDPIRKKLFPMIGNPRFMAGNPANAPLIRTALAAIVARAASTQSLKGMFTVGLAKGSTYILSKVAKRLIPFGGSQWSPEV